VNKIHIIYPHGAAESCPDRIGRALNDAFRDSYEVVLHNWDEIYRIRGGSDDILLGAPHPAPWTVFNRSARYGGFKKIVAISPLSTADLRNQAFIAHSLRFCDFFVALGGDYWRLNHYLSTYGGLRTPTVYLDLGVDLNVFRFSDDHERGFLYIGHNHWTKNTDYLTEISSLLPHERFGFLGAGEPIKGFKRHGRIPLHSKEARQVLKQYSYLIIGSRSDANPAVILEAMALGLIPICTPQCGFIETSDRYKVLNIPLDDAKTASGVLGATAGWSEEELSSLRIVNRDLVTSNFSWEKFSETIRLLVEDVPNNELGMNSSALTRLKLLAGEIRSPLAPFFREGRRIWAAPLVKSFLKLAARK
jgi:glycosyltransferase involved in cell wall biosynthesis